MTAEAHARAHTPMESPTEQFSTAMRQRGLIPPSPHIADGKIHRCDVEGKNGKNDGAYLLHLDGIPAGGFENHKDGIGWENWRADIGRKYTPDEETAHKQKVEAMRRERETDTARRHAEGQAKAKAILSAAKPATGDHPYEIRKKINACPGVMRGAWLQRNIDDCLLIPIYDGDGTLWNVEAIFTAKLNISGKERDKDFLFGARKAGMHFLIGQFPENTQAVFDCYIPEGFSTGMSIHMATALPVVVAFDAGNVPPVAEAIRKKYPNARIIIAGDDDRWRVDAQGQPLPNAGRIKAVEAANRFSCRVMFPVFADATLERLRAAGEKLPTDWNDLHCLEGMDEVRRQLNASGSNIPWEVPILFDAVAGQVIPPTILPSPYCEFAEAIAEATETPQSMATLIVLGVIALILSRKYRVLASADHSEPLNLYIFIAMLPGNRKSSIFNACLLPAIKWENSKKKELEPKIKKIVSERKTLEKIIEGKRLNAARSESPTEQAALMEEITELEANLPIVPIVPQLFITDATPESMRNKVLEQDGVLGALSDEGGIVDVIAGLYTGGNANIDIILKGIDGGHVRVERKGESVSLNPYLTFVLAVQPAVLDTMAEKKSFAGRGLLERFLYCIPQSPLGYRTHDKPPVPEKIRNDYEAAINNLLNIPKEVINGDLILQMLNVDPAALAEWKEFQREIEIMMRPGGALSNRTGWASKLPGFVLRIAANLYIARHHANIDAMQKADQEAMKSALVLGALLVEHGELAFQSMVCDELTRHARALWLWISAKGVNSISRSDITYGVKNRTTGKAETLEPLLNELIRRHLLRERKEVTGGRPVTIYDINPLAMESQHG